MPDQQTAEQREAKAVQLAEARGRRQQIVDSRLDGHEQRLNAINGSINRFTEKLAALEKTVGEAAAVQKQAAKTALDNRTFLLTAAVLAVMIIGLFVTGGH
jgi:hypothetical protein